MPAQIWTPGQVLTAAQMTSLSNLVPFFVSKSTNYSAVLGDYVSMDATGGARTVTLPSAATVGEVTVAKADGSTNVVSVVPAAGVILGPGLASAGVSSLGLTANGAFTTVQSDGTNWHVLSGAGTATNLRGVDASLAGGTPPVFPGPFQVIAGSPAVTFSAGGVTLGFAGGGFPNGLLSFQAMIFTASVVTQQFSLTWVSPAKNQIGLFYSFNGAGVSGAVQISYIAIGW